MNFNLYKVYQTKLTRRENSLKTCIARRHQVRKLVLVSNIPDSLQCRVIQSTEIGKRRRRVQGYKNLKAISNTFEGSEKSAMPGSPPSGRGITVVWARMLFR